MSLIKETAPPVRERFYPGWKLIGYRQGTAKKSRYFCYVAPFLDHIRLGFEYGVFLTDSWGILEGTGSQVRYVCIKSQQDIRPNQLTPIIREAAQLAALPKHELVLLPSSVGAIPHEKKRR